MAATILIVDDEKNILLTLKRALEVEGYLCEVAGGGQVAIDLLAAKPIDLVLMDVRMPDMDGLEALEKIRKTRQVPVIMMSGHGTIETAVKATHLGARDFLEKPIGRDRLLVAVRNALEHIRLADELAELRAESGRYEMVGRSPGMQRVYDLVRKAAPSEGRVLIVGENGTGKELIARAIHVNSRRKAGPFVKLNCAAVPHELIESELFGHERGSFTGAVTARKGKFELAHGGTLFLDEIGDMPGAMQAKLLRVLQEGEFERVGGAETLKVDVRVIAATNKDLEHEIESDRFREDLYYRLNVVSIPAPPLREHKDDIPDLVDSFMAEVCQKNGKKPLVVAPEAMAVLSAYDFPGNVRELKNLVERLAILCEGPTIGAPEAAGILPGGRPARGGRSRGGGRTFREQVEDAEREIVLAALATAKENVTEAARQLDLERGHFYKKMKSLGIRRSGGVTSVSLPANGSGGEAEMPVTEGDAVES
jgi:two-component system, NtrC family, nitrogen regulation response regulator NtrX